MTSLHASFDLFDYAEAQQARDYGISIAMANAGDWKDQALTELELIWRQRRHEQNEFLFETLKFQVIMAIGHPPSSAVWGGLCREMVKRGWIQCTGAANGQSVSSHSSLRRKYIWNMGAA